MSLTKKYLKAREKISISYCDTHEFYRNIFYVIWKFSVISVSQHLNIYRCHVYFFSLFLFSCLWDIFIFHSCEKSLPLYCRYDPFSRRSTSIYINFPPSSNSFIGFFSSPVSSQHKNSIDVSLANSIVSEYDSCYNNTECVHVYQPPCNNCVKWDDDIILSSDYYCNNFANLCYIVTRVLESKIITNCNRLIVDWNQR